MQSSTLFDRRRDILLLCFGGISILVLFIRSAALIITEIKHFDSSDSSILAPGILSAISFLFCSGLLLPIIIYTVKKLRGQTLPLLDIQQPRPWQIVAMVSGWGFVVLLGAWLSSYFPSGWIVAAPLFLLGVILPILTLIWIGTGGLVIRGPRRRFWAIFGYGLVGSTVIAMVLEYLLIGVAATGIGILSFINPELRTSLEKISTLLTNSNSLDMQSLITNLSPTITNPMVILLILLFAAVIVPLIEEAVKPAVIWFVGKRLHSPMEGFVLGLFCGAGFAMMEGLLAASSATEMWGFGLVGRAAASLMHITASGILGWGIASAMLNHRYDHLAITYLISVCIHGLWNGSAIMTVYGALLMMNQNMQINFLSGLFIAGGLGTLLLEFLLMVTTLPIINRRLHHHASPVIAVLQSDIIPPLTTSNSREINGIDSKIN